MYAILSFIMSDHEATVRRGYDVASRLAASGEDPNHVGLRRLRESLRGGRQGVNDLMNGFAAIHIAISSGASLAFIDQELVGFDVNQQDIRGETPLHHCVRRGYVRPDSGTEDIITNLLGKGANTSLEDASGKTPVQLARDLGVSGETLEMREWGRRCERLLTGAAAHNT